MIIESASTVSRGKSSTGDTQRAFLLVYATYGKGGFTGGYKDCGTSGGGGDTISSFGVTNSLLWTG